MSNIIPIRQGNRRGLSLSLDQLVGYEGVKTLAGLIQDWLLTPDRDGKRTRRVKDLAIKAGLYPNTVSRIMNRETRSPHMMTCILIFKALGFSAVRFD